jgi:lipoate-protein ligase A
VIASDTRPPGWTIEHRRGSVSDLFALDEPPRGTSRLARLYSVERPGLVLGSTQKTDSADGRRAANFGVEVLRRRSGGGAVLLWPGRQVWADFFVGATDPLWHDDVTLAAGWVGRLWASVVASFSTAPCSVHTGRLVADRWGRLVCFAGMGPGEVYMGGFKVVGVSQRRSRDRARIQTAARLQPDDTQTAGSPAGHGLDELDLLDLSAAERAEGQAVLASRCAAIPATEADLTRSLLRALQHSG